MHTPAPALPLPITLALEGGGALGAFTWGVLERLLDEPGLRIAAVGGTSAGAMDAPMLVHGSVQGGPTGAQQLLETFWQRVAIAAGSLPVPAGHWIRQMRSTFDLRPYADPRAPAASAHPTRQSVQGAAHAS